MHILRAGCRFAARFVMVIGLTGAVAQAQQTNSWTSSTSGNWEDSNWSLGVLPGPGQTVMVTNHAWKALAIGANTTANFAQTLGIRSLRVTSPGTDTVNTVLLNYAGLLTPLITGDLYVGTNAALVALNSALQVTNGFTTVEGTVIQDASSQISTVGLQVTNGGVYALTNGTLTTLPTESIQGGQFIQAGGSNFCLTLADGGEYDLRGGDLVVPGMTFGDGIGMEILHGNFIQSGGTFTGPLIIGQSGVAWGGYELSGGFLVTPYLQLPSSGDGTSSDASHLAQTGGTNFADNVVLGAIHIQYNDVDVRFGTGDYILDDGLLVTTNVAIDGNGSFAQSGGVHTNGTMSLTQTEYFHREQPGGNSYLYEVLGRYTLAEGVLVSQLIDMEPGEFSQGGGTAQINTLQMSGGQCSLSGGQLSVSNIVLSGGANFTQTGGTITQSGTLALADAAVTAGPGSQQFGQLLLTAGAGTNSTFTLSPGASALHFANSSSLVWSNGSLTISNWNGSPSGGGSQQIFFGNDNTGLTPQQLSYVQFSNPAGLSNGTYSARILSNGELVPYQGQGQGTTNSGPVNSWVSDTGGNWDTPSSWSLGVPPDSSQAVMFTNAYWKAITIDSSTVASSPQSLAVKSLAITSVSPTNGLFTTRNTLLLNYAGAGNPLVIGANTNTPGSLLIDHDSTMEMFSSGLIVNNALGETNSRLGEFQVDGTFIQSDDSEVVAGFLDLTDTGIYNMTNGALFVANQFIDGKFNQQGGRNLGSLDLESTNSDYEMFDGLVQGDVSVRAGTFHQSGGTNSATLTTGFRGLYSLAGGWLMPGDLVVGSPPQNFLEFAGGGIQQTGGTNISGDISTALGYYNLYGGVLSAQSLTLTTNTVLGTLRAGFFNQFGGYQTNGGITMRGGTNQQNGVVTSSYTLNNGILETPSIGMDLAGFNQHSGTNRVVTLSMGIVGTYVIDGGVLAVDWIQAGGGSAFYHAGSSQLQGMKNLFLDNGSWVEQGTGSQLGQLQIGTGANSSLYFSSGPCVIQFSDSTSMVWGDGGMLTIRNWSGALGGGGAQRLIFGTSTSGLLGQQLSRLQFSNPGGLPAGIYGARILSTGEVVPDTNISSSGPVNSWINPGSGNWDQPSNWSLGILPASSQSVLISNPGAKAVAINPSTPVNFPGSMTVTNLLIHGATNAVNTLLLNSFGTNVPLTVKSLLLLQDGGQILNFNSGLVVAGGTFMVTNSDVIQDGGFVRTTNAPMSISGSQYFLTNGTFEAGSVALGYPVSSHFSQYGGSVKIVSLGLSSYVQGTNENGYSLYGGVLELPGGMNIFGEPGGVSYLQNGGTNLTGQIMIEPDYGGYVGGFTLNGGLLADSGMELMTGYETPTSVQQNGGWHIITNSLVLIGGSTHGTSVDPATYYLNGGMLSVGTIDLSADQGDSVFMQSNGTVSAGTIFAHSQGYYSAHNSIMNLLGGTLSCSNYTTVDGGGKLNQSGGALVVSNLFDFGGSRNVGTIIYGRYTFTGGTLSASNINLTGDWIIGDGTTNRISNPGTITLWHTLTISNAVEQLGRLILPSTVSINLSSNAARLSFAASSGETWAQGAALVVFNWTGNAAGGGATQLKFGTDPSGLTAAQLNQIRFRIGADLYSAKILNTGEVVPDQVIAPPLTISQQGNQLILNWLPGYRLQTATDPAGPYQDASDPSMWIIMPPYTNDITADSQRFFRLRE